MGHIDLLRCGDGLQGRSFGEFIIREPIGRGGVGVVYRAEQPALAREAVVKIIQPDHRGAPAATQRFLREARIASQLDHPFAAHIYAFGAEPGGLLWIAMELVRGIPLDKLLKSQGPLPLERFVPLLERICEVVQSAHEQGIIHRDIKPSNVMVLSRVGRLLPKLLDFGIAKLVDGGVPAPAAPEDDGESEDGESLVVTRPGRQIGSPRYMAPEQWMDPGAADARTDLYALGVLTYEALTGRPPFDAATAHGIARAHASESPPPLGDGFPEGLNEVLARALAKRPADRFATVLELSAAVARAAGHSDALNQLPVLDESLKEAILEAPQPIAEAVAAVEAAHNPHQARDAAWQMVRVTMRYLGLVALACRAHASAGKPGESEPIQRALRTLRRRGLTDAEWLELARELCLPFAGRRDLHPIPEMVSLFFDHAGKPSRAAEVLDAAVSLPTWGEAGGGSDVKARDQLRQTLRVMAELLRSLGFLNDYPLVVRRGSRLERWMGIRRIHRVAPVARVQVGEGEPVLLGRDGCAVATLWPLVQVACPSGGAEPELFLLEGNGERGAKLVALPHSFELHDAAVWEWARARLPVDELAPASEPCRELAPYRGLSCFSAEDAPLFFGREREVEGFVNRLRVQPLLLLVGPSGAGKSSFVQAGVIPSLPPGWRALTVRPGPAPLHALAERLRRESMAGEGFSERLAEDEDALAEVLRAAGRSHPKLMLVIDQFEELFTLCSDAAERERYARALGRAAQVCEDEARIVLVLRDDFLMRVEKLPLLGARMSAAMELLGTPAARELERILLEPARRAGYEFEDPRLPLEMVEAVEGQPGALALLSFTAAKLWELRDRHFQQLTRRTYRALGGVGGALAQHAEATLAKMSAAEQRLVRQVFRQLITAEGTRAVLTRRDLIQVLGGDEHAAGVVERLIDARLLITQEGEAEEDRVEIIHEALLGAWPRLETWRREDLEGARLRDQLRAAARQWEARGRAKGLLWRGEALTECQLGLRRHAAMLTATEQAFVAASAADAARSRRAWRATVAATLCMLSLGLVMLWRLNQQTARQRLAAERAKLAAQQSAAESKRMVLELYIEQGRQLLLGGDPLRALAFLSEAYQQGATGTALRFLLAQAERPLEHPPLTVSGHRDGLLWVAFSPDGRRFVTASADKTAKVWDVVQGTLLFTLAGHRDAVLYAKFDPSGARLVTTSLDGTAKVWSAADGRLLFSVYAKGDGQWNAEFSPDGALLATAGGDGTARIWSAATGRLIWSLSGHQGWVKHVQFTSDGKLLATAGRDRTARVWQVATGRLLNNLRGHRDELHRVAFSGDGSRLATASRDGTARLWSVASGRLLHVLRGHGSWVMGVWFNPEGTRVLTASADTTARLWNVATGDLVFTLKHSGTVSSAAFSRNGTRIVTASLDGTARLWDASDGSPLSSLIGHLNMVQRADFAPDGSRIVTASYDGTAKLWPVHADEFQLFLKGHSAPLSSARFSADGQRVLTSSADHTVRLWDLASGESVLSLPAAEGAHSGCNTDCKQIVITGGNTAAIWDVSGRPAIRATLRGHTARLHCARFSSDGREVVTCGHDQTARIWDVETGQTRLTLHPNQGLVASASFSPDSRRLVTAGADGTAKLWDARNGALISTLAGHHFALQSVRFCPTGRWLVTASADKTAKVWDIDQASQVASLEGHRDGVSSASFSADCALVATASQDGSVRIWNAANGKQLAALEFGVGGVRSVEFSADSGRIVTAHPNGAKVWEVRREHRLPAEVAAWVRCQLPYRIVEGRLVADGTHPTACSTPRLEARR